MSDTEFIRVTARLRKASTAEERIVIVLDDKSLCFDPCKPRTFSFDSVFREDITQAQIFEDIGSSIVDGCVDGHNGTIFAYGQTGSGKTYTMFGPRNVENCLLDSHHRGLMPRTCDALFEKLSARAAEKGASFNYEVSCRFLELYNEDIYDLLSHSQEKLSIRSDSKSVQLLGASEHRVLSTTDMIRILEIGWEARRTAETAMNRESSRSHCIFSVDVKTEMLVNNFVNKKVATLNLVDLAGSERQTQSRAVGDRLKEGIKINLSLAVLGRVIRTLSSGNPRDGHVPYRESKLTLILKESLGGNSRTAVIVNVHPDKRYYADTLSSLQFAAACKNIENRVRVNEDFEGEAVAAYKNEVARLREELEDLRFIEGKTHSELMSKVSAVEEEERNWKELVISQEKALVKGQLQNDLLYEQLRSKISHEASTQLHDEMIRDILPQLWRRIESANTFEDLTKVQLINDLTTARSEAEHLQHRYESAEAGRKALEEEYNIVLEEDHKTVSESPLYRLDLNTTRTSDDNKKNEADRRKERRGTMVPPIKSVLFEEKDQSDAQPQKISSEKEAALNDIFNKQRRQTRKWNEEKKSFLQIETLLKARVEGLEMDNHTLLQQKKELQNQIELLNSKLSSSNDNKCRLEQSVKNLHSEELDLEDKIQGMQIENERLSTEVRDKTELVSDLEDVLCENNILKERISDLEAELKRYQDAEQKPKPETTTSRVVTRTLANNETK